MLIFIVNLVFFYKYVYPIISCECNLIVLFATQNVLPNIIIRLVVPRRPQQDPNAFLFVSDQQASCRNLPWFSSAR